MRQKDAFDDGIYSKDEYLSRNAKVQEQLEKAHQALQDARLATSPIVDYQEKIARFTDCLVALRDPDVSAAEKNKFLKTCIKKSRTTTIWSLKPALVGTWRTCLILI
ncbi:MAG: hypothetical protein ACLR7N_13450 [Roseburia hominis]